MAPSEIREIEQLTQRLVEHKPVADEAIKVIQAVIDSPDPAALPALRRALGVAVQYRQWAEAYAASVDSDYKKNTPGAFFIDAMPVYGGRIVSSLRSAIEVCSPEGQPVVYEDEG
jgi:hypothetical protein